MLFIVVAQYLDFPTAILEDDFLMIFHMGFRLVHSKVLVIDDTYLTLSSCWGYKVFPYKSLYMYFVPCFIHTKNNRNAIFQNIYQKGLRA